MQIAVWRGFKSDVPPCVSDWQAHRHSRTSSYRLNCLRLHRAHQDGAGCCDTLQLSTPMPSCNEQQHWVGRRTHFQDFGFGNDDTNWLNLQAAGPQTNASFVVSAPLEEQNAPTNTQSRHLRFVITGSSYLSTSKQFHNMRMAENCTRSLSKRVKSFNKVSPAKLVLRTKQSSLAAWTSGKGSDLLACF